MCGIYGFVGNSDASKNIIEGLRRLEYRGYDSWGISVIKNNEIVTVKNTILLNEVKDSSIKSLSGSTIGIGHNRWATHGGVTINNAHPHYSTDKSFVLAQNGIVENYQELKKKLILKGYNFITQTDTEVIVRLVESKLTKTTDLKEALRLAFLDLEGRNTVILLSLKNNQIISIRNGSPLVVGLGKHEIFFASDTLSFADKAEKVIYMNDLEMAENVGDKVHLYDVKNGKELKIKEHKITDANSDINHDGYDHFMLKEIVEQKDTIKAAVAYSEEELKPILDALKKAKHVYTIGAGTASFAAGMIAYYLRKHANINVTELRSYEVESYIHLFNKGDLLIAVSQSGETADTIEAIELAKKKGVKIASIVNMMGSTITRISDLPYFTRSGPEICVASTKAFTAQCAWGLLVALTAVGKYKEVRKDIHSLSESLENYFTDKKFEEIKAVAKKIKNKEHFFVLGRGQNYYISLEGSLKVKEITYKHFEGFAGGELKHGVIALIEKDTPVFV
ncbi:MAG: glutamine--fructose-6-phosphate transaminase (isomerizing), partial [Candidatus Dojkabacteria bacterium]